MLELSYEKLIPYPFDVVLSQYFDYEHIAHVHPDTLGEYRVVEQSGERIVYDQIWPRGAVDRLMGRTRVSRVEQRYFPPDVTTFEFVQGPHRGTKVHTTLVDQGAATLVRESYQVPGLPNWGWLRPLVKPFMMKVIDRVWDEDLRVDVCYGGWPGVPGRAIAPPEALAASPARDRHTLGKVTEFPEGSAKCVTIGGAEVAVFCRGGVLAAVANRCPHTGGPLALGAVEEGAIVCPWHGARFDLKSGKAISGPTQESIAVYDVDVEGDRLIIESRAGRKQ